MSKQRVYLRSFSGGEIATEMFGRIDDPKYQTGASRLHNFIVKPQGPLTRRPGTRFVRQSKNNDPVRLIPFRFSGDQSLCIQVGPGYFRFLTNGGTVVLSTEPRAYVTSKNISAGGFNTGTANQILISSAHNLVVGDPVMLTGNHPVEFSSFTIYYAIIVDSTNIKLASSAANAAAGTAVAFVASAPATARIHFVYEKMDLTRFGSHNYYVNIRNPLDTTPAGASPAAITTAGTNVTQASHGYVEGTSVVFAGSLLPPQITAGTVYFVLNPTGGSYNISQTPGGAAISMATGSGTAVRANHWYLLEDDATVIPNGSVYEVPNSYTTSDLGQLTWDGSFDVLSLATAGHTLSELRRYGATQWSFDETNFSQSITTPAQPTVTPTYGATLTITSTAVTTGLLVDFVTADNNLAAAGQVVYWSGGGTVTNTLPETIDGNGQFWIISYSSGTTLRLKSVAASAPVQWTGGGVYGVSGTINLRVTSLASEETHTYAVTAVDIEGLETVRSASQSVTNNLLVEGAYNTVTWSAVTGAVRYRVYKNSNGLYALVGEVEAPTLTFKDDAVPPNLGKTTPLLDSTLIRGNFNYPRAVAHFEQRRWCGGMVKFPQRLMGSRTGTETDYSFHIPLLDDDRISLDMASRESEIIQHIVPMAQMLLLTNAGEYRVAPVNSDALTPLTASVRPQSYVGCNTVQPSIVNNSLVFCAARGGHVREITFRADANGWVTSDLSLRAGHLFDNLGLVDQTYGKSPVPVVWFISTSGNLLGMTYVPEESVTAWHVHTTDGTFAACSAVSEGKQENIYVAVNRTINGSDVVYIEWLVPEDIYDIVDAFYVDSGVTYTNGTGSPVSTISGLTHLTGKQVAVLSNGVVESQKTVTMGGQITLTSPLPDGAKVHIGLPFSAELQTLPITMQIDGYGTGRTKNVNKVWLRVERSARFYAGPDILGLVPELTTTVLETKATQVTLPGSWNEDGQVLVQQNDPLPLIIVGMTLEVSGGG